MPSYKTNCDKQVTHVFAVESVAVDIDLKRGSQTARTAAAYSCCRNLSMSAFPYTSAAMYRLCLAHKSLKLLAVLGPPLAYEIG